MLAISLCFCIEKRSQLRERVVQDIRQSVSGVDQTVDGVSPAKGPLICALIRAAACWIVGTTRCTKKSAFTSNKVVARRMASSISNAATQSWGWREATAIAVISA